MIPSKYKALSDKDAIESIKTVRQQLGDKVLILGHHYQRDEVIQFADKKGDSLMLSQQAAEAKSEYIIFCGVKFMAETADILTRDDQIVILPDLLAGCPMADMASVGDVQLIWDEIVGLGVDASEIVPITYVNSSAEIKAFCGERGGLTCTSSNAEKIIKHHLDAGKRILFLPDRHLGENMGRKLGLSEEELAFVDYEKHKIEGEASAKMFIWNGYCPVHIKFTHNQIDEIRKEYPDVQIIVHPEVPYEVAKNADYMGSTEFIIKTINAADYGSAWAIGTETHLVNRLKNEHKDKEVFLLGKTMCMCAMMDRISPQHLLWILNEIRDGNSTNQITVEKRVQEKALIALNRMLDLSR